MRSPSRTVLALVLITLASCDDEPLVRDKAYVQFSMTGDVWNVNLHISESFKEAHTDIATIGGMLRHSLRIGVAPGSHTYNIALDEGSEQVLVTTLRGNITPILIDVHVRDSRSPSLGKIVTSVSMSIEQRPPTPF